MKRNLYRVRYISYRQFGRNKLNKSYEVLAFLNESLYISLEMGNIRFKLSYQSSLSSIPTESCRKNPKKVNSYQRQPMAEWQLRDVTHFLLEATYDLGIRYENSDLTQLSNINGKKLMEMEPRDFEKFTPGEGRKVYDYVQRNKNEEIITNGE